MNIEIEKRLNKLEEYVADEMDAIRELVKNPKINVVKLKKVKSLFDITTYKQVCEELGEEEVTCPYKMIKQIEKLFNGTWKKDWSNRNQQKWYPWFEYKGSGLVFGGSDCCCYGSSDGQVGFYKDEATSTHIGKHFINIYKQIIVD